jgi:uncharacterized membrane protein (DUF373 family)
MSDEPTDTPKETTEEGGVSDRVVNHIDRFVHGIELSAAAIFALLFAVGVFDLALQIAERTLSGRITNPGVVLGIIDTGLLLLIIVEVYKTVIEYARHTETRRIVRLIIYTGIIAMVRKVIIFRTADYETLQRALFASVSYTIIIIGLGVLLWTEERYLGD